jgi:hypothetical protein
LILKVGATVKATFGERENGTNITEANDKIGERGKQGKETKTRKREKRRVV